MSGWARTRFCALTLALTPLLSCRHQPAQTLQPQPHYVVGTAWQAGGSWFYPREDFDYHATGLAVVDASESGARLTADGELYDGQAVAGAHQTLQLPVVLRVTNRSNGRQLLVRVNDRGPADPGRVLSLTPQAASLLGVAPGAPAPVTLEEDITLSRVLAERLNGDIHLDITAAPVAAVVAQPLDGPAATSTIPPTPAAQTASADPVVPDTITQGRPIPGALWLDGGSFSTRAAASELAAAIGADLVTGGTPRHPAYTIRKGPFETVPAADAALDLARRNGLTGARIIVE